MKKQDLINKLLEMDQDQLEELVDEIFCINIIDEDERQQREWDAMTRSSEIEYEDYGWGHGVYGAF